MPAPASRQVFHAAARVLGAGAVGVVLAALAPAVLAAEEVIADAPIMLAQAVGQPPAAPPARQARPPAAPAQKGAPEAGDTGRGGEAQLRARIEQLEESLVDMQVTIGTLESLARGGGGGGRGPDVGGGRAPSAIGAGADAGRIDSLETQVRALSAQLEQLTEQIRAMGGRRSSAEPPPATFREQPPANFREQPPAAGREAPAETRPPPRQAAAPAPITGWAAAPVEVTPAPPREPAAPAREILPDPRPQRSPSSGGIMSGGGLDPRGREAAVDTDATGRADPRSPDTIGRLIDDDPSRPQSGWPSPGGTASPKQLYETAYGHLLQQNYPAAEQAFDDFLQRYPNDPLAGNAQYWLGESLFVRGQYKPAANAFLKGYQTYARSVKAPESLLKLAMSLERLGQKDAACSSYNELSSRFPNAPTHVRTRAQSERARVGC